MKSLLGVAVLALAEQVELQGGYKRYESGVYEFPVPVAVPTEVIEPVVKIHEKHAATPVAKAYDVSEPVYICPKPNYTLIGDECISETRIESKFECPPGYKFKHNGLCEQRFPPSLTCRQGTLVNGRCQQLETYEADLQCPVNTHLGPDGVCSVLEPVNYIDVCPEGTVRSQTGCLAVEYHEPVFVCPPGTVIEGKKCRREVVTYKYKKGPAAGPLRMLSEEVVDEVVPAEEEASAEGQAAVVDMDLEEEVEGETYEYLSEDVAYAEVMTASPYVYQSSELVTDQWLPAQPVNKFRPKKVAQPLTVVEDVQWEKVQVPVVVPQKVKEVRVKQPKVKEVVVKEKKPIVPQQVVKVVTQAADKVCPVGQRYGGTCVLETVVPAIRECPVPLIDGSCARRVAVAPVASCQVGNLICNGRLCKCEILTEQPAQAVCPLSTHTFMHEFDSCVHEASPRRLCPLGFFLDGDGCTCVRRDVEPALCLFSVTYACADCEHHHPLAQPITPLPASPYYKKNRKFLTGESRNERKEAREEARKADEAAAIPPAQE